MLAEQVQEWTEEWVEEGREQGIAQGIAQGREQGIAQGRAEERPLLCRQAERKFDATTGNHSATADRCARGHCRPGTVDGGWRLDRRVRDGGRSARAHNRTSVNAAHVENRGAVGRLGTATRRAARSPPRKNPGRGFHEKRLHGQSEPRTPAPSRGAFLHHRAGLAITLVMNSPHYARRSRTHSSRRRAQPAAPPAARAMYRPRPRRSRHAARLPVIASRSPSRRLPG